MVVPVCVLALPAPAWLPVDAVVPVCALELPAPAWLPVDVVVLVCALDPLVSAWLPGSVIVPVGPFEFPEDGDAGGVVVVDVFFVSRVDVPPLSLAAGDEGTMGVAVQRVVYELVVLPDIFDPEADTAVGAGVEVVVAAVLEDVAVLEVPPFAVGTLLN